LNFGFELWLFRKTIAIRTGISDIISGNKTVAAGMSFNSNNFQIDYALTKHYSLDYTNFLSLMIRI